MSVLLPVRGLEKMTFGEEVAELLDIFSGELSCCRHGHPNAQTCDCRY